MKQVIKIGIDGQVYGIYSAARILCIDYLTLLRKIKKDGANFEIMNRKVKVLGYNSVIKEHIISIVDNHNKKAVQRLRNMPKRNKESILKARRKYAQTHPEKIKEIQKKYRELHHEEILKRKREWYQNNKEKYNLYRKEKREQQKNERLQLLSQQN